LEADNGALAQRLSPTTASTDEEKISPSEAEFRYDLNRDAMATEKLAEGIRNFVADQVKLEQLIAAL
jgi:transaldolase